MINGRMHSYAYFSLDLKNGYGQAVLSKQPKGTIKIAINTFNQTIKDDVRFANCTYMGLTYCALDESYVIQYGEKMLKVLYINPDGRMKQVFLTEL